MYEVSTSRRVGDRDYELSGLVEAATPFLAARQFAVDMLTLGLEPEAIVVVRHGHVTCFRVEKNILREEA